MGLELYIFGFGIYDFMSSFLRAPTVDVGYVPNAKYLAHIPHQTKFHPIYQML